MTHATFRPRRQYTHRVFIEVEASYFAPEPLSPDDLETQVVRLIDTSENGQLDIDIIGVVAEESQ